MQEVVLRENDIYDLAIAQKGATHQELIAVEECSELIQAIIHKHRGREHNIAEEIADVEIVLEQLKIINDCEFDVALIKRDKLTRLFHRLVGNEHD